MDNNKKNKKRKRVAIKIPNPYLTGEDIDLLNDNKRRPLKKNVCDIHEDGA